MEKLAQIKWGSGKFSEVFRSTIINPSPIKPGQKVQVIWGETKKEYTAVVECYPVEPNISQPEEVETEMPHRRARTKRKLIHDDYVADYTSETETTAKKDKKTAKPKKKNQAATKKNGMAAKKDKKKEKPKGKILEVSSPSMEYVSDSEEGSDSDDSSLLSEDEPLIMAVQSALNTNKSNLLTTPYVPAQEHHPRADSPSSLGDFSEDVGVDLMNGTEMLRRAMSSREEANDVCQGASQSEIVSEFRLARTILERLECSFARQEAKLDQLLNMMREKQTVESAPTPQHSQRHQQPALAPLQQFSTPVPASGPSQSMPCDPPSHTMEFTTPIHYQQATLSDLDRLLDDSNLAGTPDLVPLGGSANVRISREDYDHALAASKPSAMTLRLLDKLFTKETLLRSTLYGTKEFAALDPSRIIAIKAEVTRAFSYQCRNNEETARMWDACKVSIGKRCQHLRKGEKEFGRSI